MAKKKNIMTSLCFIRLNMGINCVWSAFGVKANYIQYFYRQSGNLYVLRSTSVQWIATFRLAAAVRSRCNGEMLYGMRRMYRRDEIMAYNNSDNQSQNVFFILSFLCVWGLTSLNRHLAAVEIGSVRYHFIIFVYRVIDIRLVPNKIELAIKTCLHNFFFFTHSDDVCDGWTTSCYNRIKPIYTHMFGFYEAGQLWNVQQQSLRAQRLGHSHAHHMYNIHIQNIYICVWWSDNHGNNTRLLMQENNIIWGSLSVAWFWCAVTAPAQSYALTEVATFVCRLQQAS